MKTVKVTIFFTIVTPIGTNVNLVLCKLTKIWQLPTAARDIFCGSDR